MRASSGRMRHGARIARATSGSPGRCPGRNTSSGRSGASSGRTPKRAATAAESPHERRVDAPRREATGRDALAQGRAGHRAGRRPHDDLRLARVPPEVVLDRREHAGVVRLADHAAGPEHQPDARWRVWIGGPDLRRDSPEQLSRDEGEDVDRPAAPRRGEIDDHARDARPLGMGGVDGLAAGGAAGACPFASRATDGSGTAARGPAVRLHRRRAARCSLSCPSAAHTSPNTA